MQRLNWETEYEFEEKDIDKVFLLLREKFGFNLDGWKKAFDDYFMQHATRRQTRIEFFCIFGNSFINPVLNKILCRREQHPTFNKMVEYVVKGKRR